MTCSRLWVMCSFSKYTPEGNKAQDRYMLIWQNNVCKDEAGSVVYLKIISNEPSTQYILVWKHTDFLL